MAFTTHSWPSARRSVLGFLGDPRVCARALTFGLALLVTSALALVAPRAAYADGVSSASVKAAKIEATEDGHQLNADIDVQISSTLFEAARRGVSLYFVVEVEISQNRWYWLDSVVVRESRDRRVTYLPLTEQYRVTTSGVSQNVASPEDVRRLLTRVRSWTIAEKGKLRNGERYDVAVRFRLDNSQLPKPFQLNTIGSKEWNLASDWTRWSIVVGKDDK
jgi:hypothetical protein